MADTCEWASKDPTIQNFHDFEWGHPCIDSNELFEKLCLHALVATGFKKKTIEVEGMDTSQFSFLEIRENYRSLFAGFDPDKLVEFSNEQIDKIVADEKEKEKQENYKGGINKNKQVLKSLVNNAKAFNKMMAEGKSFSEFCWSFSEGKVIIGGKSEEDLLKIATEMSKGLKDNGFTYTTPTVCLAFMKTAGIVNAHAGSCPIRGECMEEAKIFNKF